MSNLSNYQTIPIYKAAMDLVVNMDLVVQGFSRYHRYDLGAELKQCTRKMLNLVREASYRENRQQKISELCSKLEELKLLCNVGRETKAFVSFKQFAQIIEQVMNVARQAEGWRRSFSLKRPESSRDTFISRSKERVLV